MSTALNTSFEKDMACKGMLLNQQTYHCSYFVEGISVKGPVRCVFGRLSVNLKENSA